MEKVLVVDNNTLFRRILEKALSSMDCDVVTAASGLEALNTMEAFRPNVILVDYVMPNIDGKMLCRIVRSNPHLRDVYIVIISAIAAEEATDIVSLGADAFIAKGPPDKMTEYIGYVLTHKEEAAARCREGYIFGIDDVYKRDITGELLQSKRHFELILDRMSEGVMEVKPDGRIVYANPVARQLFWLDEHQVLGARFVDLFGTDDQPRIRALLDPSENDAVVIDYDNPISIGDAVCTIRFVPIGDESAGVLALIDDISLFRSTESALRQSEENYRHVVNNVGVGILVAQDLKLAFINSRVADILESNVDALLSAPDPFAFIHPDDREMVFGHHIDRIEGREAPPTYAFRIVTPAGKTVWVEATNTRIDWQGRPATLNFLTDISERKQLEADREQLITDLTAALDQVKTLQGLLPICASCKKIRDDKGYWNQIEHYLRQHSDVKFSHGLCPDCLESLYGRTPEDD